MQCNAIKENKLFYYIYIAMRLMNAHEPLLIISRCFSAEMTSTYDKYTRYIAEKAMEAGLPHSEVSF